MMITERQKKNHEKIWKTGSFEPIMGEEFNYFTMMSDRTRVTLLIREALDKKGRSREVIDR